MPRVRLDEDILPVSEFRARAAELLEQIRSGRRPLVLTQRGHSAAVVLDVRDYESLVDELELLRDIRIAEEQVAAGDVVEHDAAIEMILDSLPK